MSAPLDVGHVYEKTIMKISMGLQAATVLLICLSTAGLKAQDAKKTESGGNGRYPCETKSYASDSTYMPTPNERVLETGRWMATVTKTNVKGSCWDYINEVYCMSGVSPKKETVFKSAKKGPYAPVKLVKPGDWIYHINHQFRGGEHSAIFVCWKDYDKRIAITLSHPGMNRNTTGKYGEYDLRSIYAIFRPKPLAVSIPVTEARKTQNSEGSR
jgi:hypothetical protein